MCEILPKDYKLHIAKTNLFVYKLVHKIKQPDVISEDSSPKYAYISPTYSKVYDIGKELHSEIKTRYYPISEIFRTAEGLYTYRSLEKKTYLCGKVNSLKDLSVFIKRMDYTILKCKIPKGSKYIDCGNNVFVSNCLIPLKEIRCVK